MSTNPVNPINHASDRDEPSGFNWRAVLSLALIAGTMGLAIAAVVKQTDTRITDQRLASRIERLAQLLPANSYNNALHQDSLIINAPGQFQTDLPVTAYFARMNDQVVSVIFALTTPEGYNGNIDLLVALHADGRVQAVRAVRHQETPGLGDQIELRKSDWVLQFSNLPTAELVNEDWQLSKHGGRFDQLTGATITATAIIRAVERTTHYFRGHQDELLSPPATEAGS